MVLIRNPNFMKKIGPFYRHFLWSSIPHNIKKFFQLRWGGFKVFYSPIVDGRMWIDVEKRKCKKCYRYTTHKNNICEECNFCESDENGI